MNTLADILAQPMKILRLQQNTPKWLEVRQKFRTASETPVVMGLSPWRKPGDLALEKFGGKPKVFTGNRATQHGHDQEPFARKAYEEQFGCVMKPACVIRDRYMASLDGWSGDRKTVLECKSPFSKRNGETWRSAENHEVENFYYAQIQHQLMVSGSDSCHLWVWDSATQKGIRVVVKRNLAAFEKIVKAWDAFVAKYGN